MIGCRFEITSKDSSLSKNLWVNELNNDWGLDVKKISPVKYYKVIFKNEDDMTKILKNSDQIFYDPILENCNTKLWNDNNEISYVVEIGHKPGVTDNSAKSAVEALNCLGVNAEISTGSLFLVEGKIENREISQIAKSLFGNKLINEINIFDLNEFKTGERFNDIIISSVKMSNDSLVLEVNLDKSDLELDKLSIDRCLALTVAEMKIIKSHYEGQEQVSKRTKAGLPKWPTDVELEVLAQTWSEHCKHKIFASNIEYDESGLKSNKYEKLGSYDVKGLYPTYIKAATNEIIKERNLDWAISVFSDNAGIVRFDDNVDYCIKVETHNSPSALDPYGGSLTGILGVNRDILGCGMGARPIANTNVLCFAPFSWPSKNEYDLLPAGIKHPKRIFEGVHKGIEDGGNKSGIPTVNGAIYFDQDYCGKPLVFCGTVGVLPQKLKFYTSNSNKQPNVNDRVVIVGGAVGADGVHGATFSSLELNENSPVTAVQIGDPITQKRVSDFLIEARDLGLFSCITDNGAGGISSSVGEMATLTGGANIDLQKCPLKYPGLVAYEIMISESQERMTIAVPEENLSSLLKLAARRNVLAADIGFFTDNNLLEVKFGPEVVALMDLEFLHDGLPAMNLKAIWDGPREREQWGSLSNKLKISEISKKENIYEYTFLELLKTPNIASKEHWVRRFDHEVQAATINKPFNGSEQIGPNDSGIVWGYPHGGEKENAISIACGMAPRVSLEDPYLMAQFSVDETLRNLVAQGGNPDKCCLLDNFCWPDPVKSKKNIDGDYKLGQLVRTCKGLYDACKAYGTPLVSGKDSMKNDFRGKNRKGESLTVSILPTLLVTGMAQAHAQNNCTSNFKKSGDSIYHLGRVTTGLKCSEFNQLFMNENDLQTKLPGIELETNLDIFRKLYKAHQSQLISSCHDISDGGLMLAIAESCIGGNLAAKVGWADKSLYNDLYSICDFLYNEAPGRFIVSINPKDITKFEELFGDSAIKLGEVTTSPNVKFNWQNNTIIDLPLERVKSNWLSLNEQFVGEKV